MADDLARDQLLRLVELDGECAALRAENARLRADLGGVPMADIAELNRRTIASLQADRRGLAQACDRLAAENAALRAALASCRHALADAAADCSACGRPACRNTALVLYGVLRQTDAALGEGPGA